MLYQCGTSPAQRQVFLLASTDKYFLGLTTMTLHSTPLLKPFGVITLALALVGCGDKDGKQEAKQEATQAAAKVGTEEVTVHQINQVLARTNTKGATSQAVADLSREVLEKLIDQQLAVNQATETKLNRTPEVMTQIEAARRDILARAYTQKIASAIPKPTSEEVRTYYVEHPQLFSQRRIFNVQEIVTQPTPQVIEMFKAHAAAGKPIEELAATLKAKGIQFGGGSATRAAEQFPLDLLARVHTLKDGQSLVNESPKAVTILRIASSQPSPVPEEASLRSIEQYLLNTRGGAAIAADLKDLRAKNKVSYMGEFAKPATAAANSVSTAATSASASASASESKKPDATAANAKSAIESGVAGLK